MTRRTLYFAYGSNMSRARMLARVPNAEEVGRATLRGWRLAERLYADIEPCKGAAVVGVLWAIDEAGVNTLDRCEGFPAVYGKEKVTVDTTVFGGADRMLAMAYTMTDRARLRRNGIAYPEWYRAICSAGAEEHGIRGEFTRK